MMLDDFERRKQPLLSRAEFARRQFRFALCAFILVLGSLVIGVVLYHTLESMPWIDALLNASMIMGGMGPVNELHTSGGKLFASGYALYCGAVLLIAIGILMAPIAHRVLHRFHLDIESQEGQDT